MVNPLLCVVLTPCKLCVHIIINSEPGERVHKPAFSHFPWFHSVSPFSSQVSAKGGKAGAGRDKLAHSRVTRRRDGGQAALLPAMAGAFWATCWGECRLHTQIQDL